MSRGNRRKGQRSVTVLPGLRARGASSFEGLRRALRERGLMRRGNRRRASARRSSEPTSATRALASPAARPSALRALGAFIAWALPLVVAVVAFATPLLGVRAYQYVMSSDHFMVRQVLIEGNSHLDYDAISELLAVSPGAHLLQTDLDELTERLKADPWVSWSKVTRELPDRLIVQIVEHDPAAYLSAGDLYLVDRRGEVFARAGAEDTLDLPIITGVSLAALDDPAQRAHAESRLRGAINVAQLYRSMGLAGRWPIGELRVEASGGLTLVLSPSGTEAVLGHAPFHDKLYRLEWVLESLRQEGKSAEYVLLDSQGLAPDAIDDGRVIVRADLMSRGDDVMTRAAERARRAERSVLGLPPDPNLFGPALAPALRPLAADADAQTDDEQTRRPTLSGGRPARAPEELDGEE